MLRQKGVQNRSGSLEDRTRKEEVSLKVSSRDEPEHCYVCHAYDVPEEHHYVIESQGNAKLHSDGCVQVYLLSEEGKKAG